MLHFFRMTQCTQKVVTTATPKREARTVTPWQLTPTTSLASFIVCPAVSVLTDQWAAHFYCWISGNFYFRPGWNVNNIHKVFADWTTMIILRENVNKLWYKYWYQYLKIVNRAWLPVKSFWKTVGSGWWKRSSVSHLVTFEGRSHQDNRPHGGNHVIWRDVLSLEGRARTHTHTCSHDLISVSVTVKKPSILPSNINANRATVLFSYK